MTETNPNLTEAQIKNIVDKRVEERLNNETQKVAESIPFTRREILKGVSILGLGAVGAGLGTYGAVGRAAAQTSGGGSGSIGTEEDPLAAIYVDELYQNEEFLNLDGLSIQGNALYMGDNVTVDDMDNGDYLIQ